MYTCFKPFVEVSSRRSVEQTPYWWQSGPLMSLHCNMDLCRLRCLNETERITGHPQLSQPYAAQGGQHLCRSYLSA
jgi:hypothetical protein